MKPRDALQLLDQVGANFQGNRQDHLNIQQPVMALRVFIEQYDPLEPSEERANIPANENPAKNDQKTPEEIAAEVRAKGEK